MKENYEIYLNYTPWKCPFIIKDLTKIIEDDDNTDLSGELACAGGVCEIKFV